MGKRRIGGSNLKVSPLSLGSMTFGAETKKDDAETQLDFALNKGINLIDTAEIYPAPVMAATYGESETIIGEWLKKRKNRNRVIISTKAAGPGKFINWVRGGESSHNKKNLVAAVEGSLRRLKTDYIDLFHLHWPDRAIEISHPSFNPPKKELDYSFARTMEALNELTLDGKIRFVGFCNESPWGIMKLLEYRKYFSAVEIVSVQNPYNLLSRDFEYSHAEVAYKENLSLLAYSPLAMGLLTDNPSDSLEALQRKTKRNPTFKKYRSSLSRRRRDLLVALAATERTTLSQVALDFVISRPFIASAIIGCTNIFQLKENLTRAPKEISKSLEKKINSIHKENQSPCL